MSVRLPDWRARLGAFIVARRNTPHVWGAHDCSLTAADMIEAETGVDPAIDLRGRYTGAYSALRALRSIGHRSVVDMLDALFPRTGRVREGDCIAIGDGPLPALLIADGRGAAWGQDANGLVRLRIPHIFMAWSI